MLKAVDLATQSEGEGERRRRRRPLVKVLLKGLASRVNKHTHTRVRENKHLSLNHPVLLSKWTKVARQIKAFGFMSRIHPAKSP